MRGLHWSCLALSLFVIACGGGGEATDNTTPMPACSDGLDNDGDGMSDFPDDLSCASTTGESEDGAAAPQCSDNRDNDGDGKKDFPNDPGCFAPQADDESDDCPSGPGCSQCANGKDDDASGAMDFPNDPSCESAADNTEFDNNPNACGAGLKIKQLPADGTDIGQLEMGSASNIVSPCGGGLGAAAVAYVVHLTSPKVIVASTDMPGTATDTVIDIRAQDCMNPSSELACSDDISATNDKSKVTKSLPAGVYYIIVQGQNPSALGAYQLKVEKFNGEGETCLDQTQCGPGLYCRIPVGQTAMICAKPVCNDGLDDDTDGKIDYPNDPGCATPDDDTENDTCPGAGCPECGDGVDNDLDTKTDYPMDTTCKAAGDTSESCPTSEGVVSLTTAVTMGDTTNATSDYSPTCSGSGSAAPDRHYRLDVPALTSLQFNTTGFDTSTVLLNSTCGGTAIACSDPAIMNVGALAAGTYYFVVDGYFTTSKGPFTINTTGKIANGAACDAHPLSQAGALTCGNGYACKGTTGAKTCQPAQCGDGMDNNGNGKTDYPADPGCTSTSDDTETTVCPGASCPVCANGVDDDMDGQTDYPADPSCVAASGNNESCTSTEPVITVMNATTMGDTSTATDDVKLACGSTTATAKDLHHKVQLPAVTTVTLSLTNKTPSSWDSTIALFGSSCTGTALSCQDGDSMTLTNLAAGNYFFVVDGYSTASGGYTLNVSGTIANGGSCEVPLAQSGALTCGPNYACKGAVGAKTCQLAQCADGIDNNGAGGIDYPNDPGCASSSDDTETTVCPGAGCPVCANGLDDDTDTKIDFPMDFGCAAAGGTTEVFCTGEPNVAMNPITTAITMGDNTATADNYDQTCQSNTGNDMAFALQLPVAVASLVIDTETTTGTVTDTVVSLKDASCGTQLGCDDDTGTGNFSKLTVTNVPAGGYAIQVDAYSTGNNGPFALRVVGTVAPMTSCTSPLFAGGVLVCPTGTTCTGTPAKCQ